MSPTKAPTQTILATFERLGLESLLVVAVSLISLGASCHTEEAKGESPATKTTAPATTKGVSPATKSSNATTPAPMLTPSAEALSEALPGVDTGSVEAAKRALLIQVGQDAICDCGRPATLSGCLHDPKPCELGKRMGALAVVLTKMGGTSSEVTNFIESYFRDFAVKRRHTFTLNEAACEGPADAPITLTEFADFECPYCGASWPLFGEVVKAHKAEVRLCFLNFPLKQHDYSRGAAMVAIYASEQGKFVAAADLLFSKQLELEPKHLLDYATKLGLDRTAVEALLDDGSYDAKVEAERQQGVKAGITGTPSLFINGRLYAFPLDGALIMRSIQDEIDWMARGKRWTPLADKH